MQENQQVKSKNAAKDVFWNEVKRVSLASEAAKDGHTFLLRRGSPLL